MKKGSDKKAAEENRLATTASKPLSPKTLNRKEYRKLQRLRRREYGRRGHPYFSWLAAITASQTSWGCHMASPYYFKLLQGNIIC